MEILLTALAIFVLTLLVPAPAQENEEERATRRRRAIEKRSDALELARIEREAAEQELARSEQAKESALELARAKKDELDAVLAVKQAEAELAKARGEYGPQHIKNIKDATDELEKHAEVLDKVTKAEKAVESAAKGLANELGGMLGVSEDLGDSLTGSFILAAQNAGSLSEIFKEVDDAFGKVFSASNILASGLAKLQEMTIGVALAQDQAISGFIKATGTSGAYTEAITDAYFNTRTLGVEMNEAAEAAMSLYTEFAVFTSLGNDMKQMLIENVAEMQEFGIATSDSAAALNTMVMAFGMTVREADSMQMELINTAEAMGMPPARMMSELARVGPELAAWGSNATEVFEGLMEVSRRTGMEMGNLLGVANQFDTFYGAAEAVGRLNSLLGGPFLNAVELVNMEQDEIIHTLHGVMDAAGLSFEALGRHQRQAFATAAGFSSVADAAAVFGENFERNLVLAEQEAAAERDRAARAEQAKSVYESLAIAAQTFAISMGPVIEVLKGVLIGFAGFVDFFTGMPIVGDFTLFAIGLASVAAGIMIFKASIGGLFAPLIAMGTSLKANVLGLRARSVAATQATATNQALATGINSGTISLTQQSLALRTNTGAIDFRTAALGRANAAGALNAGAMTQSATAATGLLGGFGRLGGVLRLFGSIVTKFIGPLAIVFTLFEGIKFLFGLGADDANTVGGSARLAAQGMREYDQATRDATRSSQRMVGTFTGLQDGFRVTATQVNETRKMTMATTAIVADGTDILRNSKAALELVRTEDIAITRMLEKLHRTMVQGNEIQERGNQGDLILKVNDRELARHTEGVMNKKLRLQREQVSG